MRLRVLVCDLNNFARYPTISVGYLVAVLRQGGHDVRVFSPWGAGIGGYEREPPERPWSLLDQRLRFLTALSASPLVRTARAEVNRRWSQSDLSRQATKLEQIFVQSLGERPDVVFISTYLMYRDVVERLCAICAQHDVPTLVGGPYFTEPRVRDQWRHIPGLSALAIGENEFAAARMAELLSQRAPPASLPSVATSLHEGEIRPTPYRQFEQLPYPDYSDFPWARYPTRIVSTIAGRGCGWGACRFCSDITSTAGRSFRPRSADAVLAELEHQCARYDASHVVFTDLKINSDLSVWHGLVEGLARVRKPAQWIAAVHIDGDGSHGLDRGTLRDAANSGLVRITTGLESGSQRVLDSMRKGTQLEETSRVLNDVAAAPISVRTTVMVGYPGETPTDLAQTSRFLDRHKHAIERVSLNRFTLMSGTVLDRLVAKRPDRFPTIRVLRRNDAQAVVEHVDLTAQRRDYRRQLWRLLGVVHDINRRPLMQRARAFDGVM